MRKNSWKEHLTLLTGLGLVIMILYITGIGCPIKWLTGISCAGCGLTRACISALHLRMKEAFFYHPLFLFVPVALVLYLFRDRLPQKLTTAFIRIGILAFLAVYVMRMINPDDRIVIADWHSGVIGRILQNSFLMK